MARKLGPDPIDVHVGRKIKIRRLVLRMSQEKLAEGLGITFQQVQKYEKGTNRVGASRLQMIASILQVPVGYFFTDADAINDNAQSDPQQEDAIVNFLSSKEGLELNKAFIRLPAGPTRQSIVLLVKSLATAELGAVEEDPKG
jgi:transcriptional regulator with XRE-family HTH domain